MKKATVCVVLLFVAMGLASSSPIHAQPQEDTPKSLEPRRGAGKIGFLYKASRVYLLAGTALDATSTARLMGHPTLARREDGTVLARYYGTETGWASHFGGRRNTGAAIAANVALNAGMELFSRKMYRRGGRWRILAIAVNVFKGTDSMVAGIRNIRHDPDRQVREVMGYRGQIVWSR